MKGWSEERLVEFGDRIRQRRIQEDLSQQQLASQVGISRVYLSQIERGLATNLSWNIVSRVSERLGLYSTERRFSEAVSDSTLPSGLAEFQTEAELPEADMRMLCSIEFRGRRPQTAEQWKMLYNLIEAMSRTWEK